MKYYYIKYIIETYTYSGGPIYNIFYCYDYYPHELGFDKQSFLNHILCKKEHYVVGESTRSVKHYPGNGPQWEFQRIEDFILKSIKEIDEKEYNDKMVLIKQGIFDKERNEIQQYIKNYYG